jgi:large subunit ribosomal protein L24
MQSDPNPINPKFSILNPMKLRKGDTVFIIAGKDKGRSGTVTKILTDKNRVLVKDANILKKRTKPTKQGEKGQTVEVSRSMDVSNVMLLCKNCKKPTRIGFRIEGDTKVRVCKQCEAVN